MSALPNLSPHHCMIAAGSSTEAAAALAASTAALVAAAENSAGRDFCSRISSTRGWKVQTTEDDDEEEEDRCDRSCNGDQGLNRD